MTVNSWSLYEMWKKSFCLLVLNNYINLIHIIRKRSSMLTAWISTIFPQIYQRSRLEFCKSNNNLDWERQWWAFRGKRHVIFRVTAVKSSIYSSVSGADPDVVKRERIGGYYERKEINEERKSLNQRLRQKGDTRECEVVVVEEEVEEEDLLFSFLCW